MKVVYLAGPISRGDVVSNVAQADYAMRDLMAHGFAVINPMLTAWAGACLSGGTRPHPQAHSIFRTVPWEQWIAHSLEIAARCDYVVRLPGESRGADMEVSHARDRGIPVYFSVYDFLADVYAGWRLDGPGVVADTADPEV